MSTINPPRARQRGTPLRRPRSVTLVGFFLLLYGLALLGVAGLFTALFLWPESLRFEIPQVREILASISRTDAVLLGGQVLIGVFLLIGGVGLLQLRAWAWLMSIIGLGVHLLILLIDYWRSEPIYWGMLVSALLCFLLNLREVKQTLGLIDNPTDTTRPHDAWQAPSDAPEHRSLSRRS